MSILFADKNPPVPYIDQIHGVEFIIVFKWEGPSANIPSGVVALTNIDGNTVVAGYLSAPWDSFDAAVNDGKLAADAFVKRYWVD